jgi:hypothetical protein
MLLPKFHRSGIFSRGSTGIPPHLDHTSWCCPPESGVWIPLVVVLQVEYSTKKLPRQSTGNTTEIPLVLRLQETISCVRAIQSRLFVRAAASTKSDNPPWWRHRNRPRRSLSKMIEKKQLCIMDHLHPIEYRSVLAQCSQLQLKRGCGWFCNDLNHPFEWLLCVVVSRKIDVRWPAFLMLFCLSCESASKDLLMNDSLHNNCYRKFVHAL